MHGPRLRSILGLDRRWIGCGLLDAADLSNVADGLLPAPPRSEAGPGRSRGGRSTHAIIAGDAAAPFLMQIAAVALRMHCETLRSAAAHSSDNQISSS